MDKVLMSCYHFAQLRGPAHYNVNIEIFLRKLHSTLHPRPLFSPKDLGNIHHNEDMEMNIQVVLEWMRVAIDIMT